MTAAVSFDVLLLLLLNDSRFKLVMLLLLLLLVLLLLLWIKLLLSDLDLLVFDGTDDPSDG